MSLGNRKTCSGSTCLTTVSLQPVCIYSWSCKQTGCKQTVNQMDAMDCGPTCLRMIAKYYDKAFPLPYLREKCYITREGVSMKGISEAAETIGFRSLAVKIPFTDEKDKPSLLGMSY